MPIFYRHGDPRFPFLWESGPQAPARWHDAADAPASYYADTPDGAWAEFLRHEGITDPADLPGVERRLWAVDIPDGHVAAAAAPALPLSVTLGGTISYPQCQAEARRLRATGTRALLTPSAALLHGAARGQQVVGGLQEGPPREGTVIVLFGGTWPDVTGWAAVAAGAPPARTLSLVRHL